MVDVLNAIRNRPRFKLETSLTPEEFTEKLRSHSEIDLEDSSFRGKISSQESYFELKTSYEAIWKPRLTLRVEDDPDEGVTYVRGIFGPRPSIWTFFMFLYISLGVVFITLGSLYYSMHLSKSLNDKDFSWVVWGTIFSLIGIIVTYIIVKIAQFKARDEMRKLRELAESIILKYKEQEKVKK